MTNIEPRIKHVWCECRRSPNHLSIQQQTAGNHVSPLKRWGHVGLPLYFTPLKRWGHVGLPLSAQFVRLVCVCAFSPFVCSFLSCRQSNTKRWPNAGLMLAHHLRRWPSISPVLGYSVVFGTLLNVGQRHRRRANINPALVQSIVLVYCQHEVLTRAE